MDMEIKDAAFGVMHYDYGWVKEEKLVLFEETYQITCVASAYKGQEIEEIQRREYMEYRKDRAALGCAVEDALYQYCESRGITETEKITACLKPTELIFQRDGRVGLLLDCAWEAESGIVVFLKPEIKVDIQDTFL